MVFFFGLKVTTFPLLSVGNPSIVFCLVPLVFRVVPAWSKSTQPKPFPGKAGGGGEFFGVISSR